MTAEAPVAPVGLACDLVHWQRLHGRHDLPWQRSGDPYRIWLSEVMLQQTQVVTAIAYFNAFVAAFPTVRDLAAAPIDQVMSLWSGLGYYSRARNLHAAAKRVVDQQGGLFPSSAVRLAELPGVGRSTAAAVAVFGFGERAAILDGNVKRVFCRVFGIDGHPGETAVMRRLWAHAQAELPPDGISIQSYTQGLMDLGATLCTRTRPDCQRCPLQTKCIAHRNDAVSRYPASRPRRPVPLREVDMLLLCSGATVLIEQRPPVGIWGGLWSLPEIGTSPASPASPASKASQGEQVAQVGQSLSAVGVELSAERITPFARFEHAFTHFRMKAQVWRAELDAVEAGTALRQATVTRWLPFADAAAAPLPQPIKALLKQAPPRPR